MEYQNILVVCLRKIGDAVISTAGVSLLRKAYPRAKITMLVRPLVKSIVENNSVVDAVMLYNYTHQSKWAEMRQIAGEIKSRRFDLAVVLDGKPRSGLLVWLAGVPKRAGFERISFRNCYVLLFYTDLIRIDYPAEYVQQAKNHEIFINRLTGRTDVAKCSAPDCGDAAKTKIDGLLQETLENKKRRKIGLCLRSGQRIKDWPLERFAAVIDALYETYPEASFYVIGSLADREAAEKFRSLTKAPVILLCGDTSLPELAYLLSRLDFFLTVDTGAAHLAAAAGNVPIVTVFGGTSDKKWGPYSPRALNVSASGLSCRPCSSDKAKCADPLPACLRLITAEKVLQACKLQIGKYEKERQKP